MLILLLEADLADVYYCLDRVELHWWCNGWSGFRCVRYEWSFWCRRSNILFLPVTHFVPYYYARLVMNRHFCGPSHGPYIKIIEDRGSSVNHADGCVESSSQHARVIEDQLTVKSAISLWHARGHIMSLGKRIDDLGPPICNHLSFRKPRFKPGPVQLPGLVEDMRNSCGFQVSDHALGSCPVCATDYSIAVLWQSRKKGYIVKVRVYKRLGGCRSPVDAAWTTMSIAQDEKEPRIASEQVPGSVGVSWGGARDPGKWVEIP